MAAAKESQSAATRLRQQLADRSNIVVAPGVYDGFTARLALSVGFDALYMTGFGTSLSRIGWPDLGLASLPDMKANAELIASLSPNTPVIADADTGYGGPAAIARTVTQYATAGLAAFHLEDQVQSKRCGHLTGKELVDQETFATRIRAAHHARERIKSEILIIARSDALAVTNFEDASQRLLAARDAGADIIFLEGIRNEEDAKRIIELMGDTPVLLNLVPGGLTPNWSVPEAKELGFRMMIVPLMLLEVFQKTGMEELTRLKKEGKVGDAQCGPRGLSELCGLDEIMQIDAAAGGKSLGGI